MPIHFNKQLWFLDQKYIGRASCYAFKTKFAKNAKRTFWSKSKSKISRLKNVTNLTRHHFWCHQYSSHKLAIISQLNVVLSHYLFSTITVIYVLQSFVWLTSNESYVMTHNWWVIAVFYLYIDHCHEHVSWTVAIHNILHQNCLFIFNGEWG